MRELCWSTKLSLRYNDAILRTYFQLIYAKKGHSYSVDEKLKTRFTPLTTSPCPIDHVSAIIVRIFPLYLRSLYEDYLFVQVVASIHVRSPLRKYFFIAVFGNGPSVRINDLIKQYTTSWGCWYHIIRSFMKYHRVYCERDVVWRNNKGSWKQQTPFLYRYPLYLLFSHKNGENDDKKVALLYVKISIIDSISRFLSRNPTRDEFSQSFDLQHRLYPTPNAAKF